MFLMICVAICLQNETDCETFASSCICETCQITSDNQLTGLDQIFFPFCALAYELKLLNLHIMKAILVRILILCAWLDKTKQKS